jgi:hypothetical protein
MIAGGAPPNQPDAIIAEDSLNVDLESGILFPDVVIHAVQIA